MIAAVMCGGRASRMQASIEKPLLKVGGVAMVERIVLALASTQIFDRIVAAASPLTPMTREFLISKGIEMFETAGDGYPQDLSRLLSRVKPEKVMVVPADIPLLDPQTICDIIDATRSKDDLAISIVLEKAFVEDLGATPSVVFDRYCHSGITIFDAANIVSETVSEGYIVMNRKEIALNVNTKKELELAELLIQHA